MANVVDIDRPSPEERAGEGRPETVQALNLFKERWDGQD